MSPSAINYKLAKAPTFSATKNEHKALLIDYKRTRTEVINKFSSQGDEKPHELLDL